MPLIGISGTVTIRPPQFLTDMVEGFDLDNSVFEIILDTLAAGGLFTDLYKS